MRFITPVIALLALAAPAAAQPAATPPKLIVAISVDQLSADLLAEYRGQFREGFARLLSGAVFPAGYQSHAATETCPGHSTILTGSRPSRTGIIGNGWWNLKASRTEKEIYCAEDEAQTGEPYVVSPVHLRVPTLGDRLKAVNPATRVVSVAGKDRSAVMMGGRNTDEAWWWGGKGFVTYAGKPTPGIVTRINALVTARLAQAQPAMELPAFCKPKDRAYPTGPDTSVGSGRMERAAGNTSAFRASPEFDEVTLALAAGFVTEMKLGQGAATDVIAIGASATDYVGHGKGTEGTEMCLQLLTLDQYLGRLFAVLDRTGVDYAVVLTADHGGHDMPERHRDHGAPMADRMDAGLAPATVGKAIAQKLGLQGQLLWGGMNGDVWIDPALTPAQHGQVLAEAAAFYSSHRQVEAVLTKAQVAATPSPSGPPENWTLLQRARASFDAERSGDFQVALKPRITPIPKLGSGSVATHGSFWDYDRRVPILFWRKGMTGFEQPLSAETADIMPTLAALIGLPVPAGEIDGRCLDLDAGPGTTCR